MQKQNSFLVVAGVSFVAIGVTSWAVSLSRRAANVTRPSPQTTSLQTTAAARPPYDPNEVQTNLEFWAKQAQSDSQGVIARTKLAQYFLESYRETGDIAAAKRAEKAAREALKIRTLNNPDALFQLSRSLLTQHRFQEALVYARRAALLNSENNRQCADIELELGDYQAAEKDFAKVRRDENDPSYLALAARFHELHGRTEVQFSLLQKAAKLAAANYETPHQSVAWFYERLGHCLAMQGKLDAAEASYKAGLQDFPRDYRTMAAMAHVEANRNDWPKAIEWAKKAAAMVPAPETIALLGDAYAAIGESAKAKIQYAIIEDMGTLEKSQGVIYDRQRALFNAEHNRDLPEAIALARGELKARRDIYSFDTLAWVLYKSGKFDEAQKLMQPALAQGTKDATLFFHAGMIANARGQHQSAQKYLSKALEINPQFHPSAPKEAQALLSRLNLSDANRQVASH